MTPKHIRSLIIALLELNCTLDNGLYDLVCQYLAGIYTLDNVRMDNLFNNTEKIIRRDDNGILLVSDNELFKITIEKLT